MVPHEGGDAVPVRLDRSISDPSTRIRHKITPIFGELFKVVLHVQNEHHMLAQPVQGRHLYKWILLDAGRT